MRNRRMLAAVFALVVGVGLAGCSARQPRYDDGPVTPPTAEEIQAQRERACTRAEGMVALTGSGAAFAVLKSDDEELRMYVASAIKGLLAGAADYCTKVRAGLDADAIDSAMKALQAALDELTDRTLALPAAAPPV